MDRRLVAALALAGLLALAGCANPLGPADTPTATAPLAPAESPTPTTGSQPTDGTQPDGTPTATAAPSTATPTTPTAEDFPEGVSRDGIDNASTLLGLHTRALERTGFVAVGNGTSVVRRSGILVGVESSQRNHVAANGTVYATGREVTAGPLQREVDAWSNGSVEFVRTQEGSETNYTTREPRPIERLAGRVLLRPYLRGGDYEASGVRNGSDGRRLVVLDATEVENATLLSRALTDDAEEIKGYEATLVVDWAGRIRSLEATIEYVIDGRDATQEFRYALVALDGGEVQRPDWVDAVEDESRADDPDEGG